MKYAKPALQHIQTIVGGADQLKELATRAYNFKKQQEIAAEGGDQEESK